MVLMDPRQKPPVCRMMDGERFVQEQREKLAKKRAELFVETLKPKEMRFSCNISDHDAETKLNKVNDLLEEGYAVRLTVFFAPPIPYSQQLVDILFV